MIVQDDVVGGEMWGDKSTEKEESENFYDNAHVSKEPKFSDCPPIPRERTLSFLLRSFRVSQ
jgi:hypothetical protein